MATKSTLINMVLCLSGVCLVCSAVLAGSYAVTKEPIEAAETAKINASIAEVLPEFSVAPEEGSIELEGVSYSYYKVAGAGYAVKSVVNGFGGPLSLMVGVTEDGIVHNTKVISHSETPGLGAKCQTDAGFIAQFRNWNPAQKTLKVKKDGGDVDAITASTITSRAYALAIENALKLVAALNIEEEGGQNNE